MIIIQWLSFSNSAYGVRENSCSITPPVKDHLQWFYSLIKGDASYSTRGLVSRPKAGLLASISIISLIWRLLLSKTMSGAIAVLNSGINSKSFISSFESLSSLTTVQLVVTVLLCSISNRDIYNICRTIISASIFDAPGFIMSLKQEL